MKTVARSLLLITLLLSLSFLLAACGDNQAEPGSEGAVAVVGDASRGETLYKQTTIGSASAPGCITCHSLDEGVKLVGPSHAGMGARAATTAAGKSAEDFLHESIVTPDAAITEGFTAGVMYQNYANELSDQEIADLVAYLLTLQ